MSFRRQLRFLLWKNFLIRSRQKIWVAVEILCPLALFLILVLLRKSNTSEPKPECHYPAKALPSAGFLPFIQSYFCTITNNCSQTALKDDDIGPANLPENSILKTVGAIVADFLNNPALPGEMKDLSDVMSVIVPNRHRLEQLLPLVDKFLLNSKTNPSKFGLDTLFDVDPSLLDFGLLDGLAFLDTLRNDSEFMGKLQNLANSQTFLPVLQTVERSMALANSSGNASLDFVTMFTCGEMKRDFGGIIKKKDNIKRLNERFKGGTGVLDDVKGKHKNADKLFRELSKDSRNATTICGNFTAEPGLDEKCSKWLSSFGGGVGRAMVVPFSALLRGYILVTPQSSATKAVVEKMERWLQGVNFLKYQVIDFYYNAEHYQDALANSSLSKAYFAVYNYCRSHNDSWCEGMPEKLERFYGFFVSSNNTAATLLKFKRMITPLANMLECFRTDRFRFTDTEYEMEKRAMCLTEKNRFFAGVVFDGNATDTKLKPLAVYKIRQPNFISEGTYIRDGRWSFSARDRPWEDTKYIYFGFSFLQDAVERAIIEVQTNTSQKIGAYFQQFPNPCYVNDGFTRAIERTLPLLMVMAWVFTAALIIKNVVYEKEMRLKEFMKVMGLGNLVHWVAWFVQSIVFATVAVFLFVITIKYGRIVEHSDFSVLLVFVLLFMIATITQSFLISTFFSKANLAAACGAVIYFLFYLPYWVVTQFRTVMTFHDKMASCLSAQVAFGWGCTFIADYEIGREGVTWKNINARSERKEEFTLAHAMCMMIVDSIIYMILTWYIEAVFPGEYGIPRPFYFFATKSYWMGTKPKEVKLTDLGDIAPEVKKFTEAEPTQLPLGVAVRHLKKIYSNGKMALSGISLNFYESQITSFLGHNGAGKTTTLSILTGLFPPTEGTVLVYGNDVRTRIDQIRKSLGMCPQHNILFGQLTVRQQLTFYAGLKGVPLDKIKDQVNEMIGELGLSPKADTVANDLSGGTQRRLAIAAAFIGGSKTVILDEPTAGVDPCARRLIWDLLLRKKEGRTIILSTHFMDEADVLGDRIAIIGEGKLICCGSSMFLKKCYGSGYRLTMVRKCPTTMRPAAGVPNEAGSSSTPTSSGAALANIKSNASVIDSPDYDKMINEFITSRLPGSVLSEDLGQEFTYNVPSENPKALHTFFVELESKLDHLNISSYGVSEAKLEEIFLKAVGVDEGEEKKVRACATCCPTLRRKVSRVFRKKKKKTQKPIDDVNLMDSSDEDMSTSLQEVYIDPKMDIYEHSNAPIAAGRQLAALLEKRALNFLRSIKGAFAEIVVPILLIALVLYVLRIKPPQTSPKMGSVVLIPWVYGPPNFAFQKLAYSDYPNGSYHDAVDETAKQLAFNYVKALNDPPGMGVRCVTNQSWEEETGSCEPVTSYSPIYPPEPTPASQNATCRCNEKNSYECPMGTYQPPPPVRLTNTTDFMVNMTFHDTDTHNITTWLLMTEEQYRLKRYGGFSFGDLNIATPNVTLDWNVIASNVEMLGRFFNTSSHLWNINWTKEHESAAGISVDLSDTKFIENMSDFQRFEVLLDGLETRSSIKIWFNNQGWQSGPAYASVLSNAVLRAHLKNSSKDPTEYGILGINHLMNWTRVAIAEGLAAPDTNRVTFEASMVMLAFCIVPASFVLFIIDENIAFSKHMQFVSGVRPILYWLSNFIWDITNFVFPAGGTMILFYIFNEEAYIGLAQTATATFCLMMLYGFAIIPMMYPWTFVFKIPSLAFIILTMASVLTGWITVLTTMIYDILGETDKDMIATNEILMAVFLIFPQFCLGRGLMDMKAAYYLYRSEKYLLGDKAEAPNLFRWEVLGRNMFCMLVEGCFWFGVVILIEYRAVLLRHLPGGGSTVDPKEDEDVRREREKIMSAGNKEQYALKIKSLTKVFSSGCGAQKKVVRAVDNLCVGIKAGECFGLLGVNGAGKTTTFSMLTGRLLVTSGDALINGSSILTDMGKVCRQVGFCPQFDALHPLLTARQELRFYARLRGIKKSLIDKVVSRTIIQLGLRPHADRQAGTYSGGNKRKLSTAIAIIGRPAVVLLDEPTTGMDPKARRFLWNRITELVRDGRTSVVLTSHSMEECEALCNRIGIMVNGRFRCLGSTQHLKSRFGQGYTLTIKIGGTKPKTTEAIEFIRQRFPGVELKEQHLSQLRFQLPPSIKALSDVFACMVDAVKVLNVDDYTLSQTTLEEVFVSFAQEQGSNEKTNSKKKTKKQK